MSKGGLEFEVGELILALHGSHIYPAKVRTLRWLCAERARAVETRATTHHTHRTRVVLHPTHPSLTPLPP